MKRRSFVTALAAAPVAPALSAQQQVSEAQAQPLPATGRSPAELPKIDASLAEDASEPVVRFFSERQFAALRRLCDLLMPAMDGTPGALEAHAPEFLDFLVKESPGERQRVYLQGLDALNQQAAKQFEKPFADLDAGQAARVLAPLRVQWTYQPPADPLARFLQAAKHDVRTATVNSHEYSAAGAATGRRSFFGAGMYWYPLD